MRSWVFRHLLRVAVGIVAVTFILVPSVMAQDNSRQPAISQFLANPSQALQQYPNGGAQLISLIRDVALANPSALSTIIALLSSANPDQQMAIGSGLGQAAQSLIRTNQAYANQIQQALAASGFQNAITAFAAVTGNVLIGAAGGAGGGAGGGGGGGGQTGPGGLLFGGPNQGTGQTYGGQHYQTPSHNLFTGGSSVGGTTSNNASVSPH